MKKIRVAITGSIGSGKSLISGYFEKQGFPVIKSDLLAKELMETDKTVRKKIINEFGPESYHDGRLNRPFLADRVFINQDNVDKINSIVHPAVIRSMNLLTKDFFETHDIVFVESALIFEAKLRKFFDYVILVSAHECARIDRVKKRDGITEGKIRDRMRFQMEDEKKKQNADFVIENNSSIPDLERNLGFVSQIIKSFINN